MQLPTDRDELRSTLMGLFKRIQGQMADWRDRSSVFYRLYYSYVDEEQYPLPFKMFFPYCHSTIQTLMPRYIHGLLYRHPFVEVMPAGPRTDPASVENANRLLNKWFQDTQTWVNIVMMLKESLITGTSAGYIEFMRRKRKMVKRTPVRVGLETVSVTESETWENVLNRPMLRHTDMYDVYPDLDRVHTEDLRFVFRLIIKGMDEIRADADELDYQNLDELEAMGDWPMDQTMHEQRLRTSLVEPRMRVGIFDPAVVPDHPRCLLECTVREWTPQGEIIRIITLGNDEVFVRDETLDYFPWVFFKHNQQPLEFLGRSVLEPIERLQLGFNDMLNMNLTNMLAAISKLCLIGDEAEIDPDQLVLAPLSIVQGADITPNSFRMESFGDLNQSGMRLEQTLGDGIQQATGISDFLRGANPQRKEFASTVMALQQAAEAPIDADIKFLEKTGIIPIARAFVECAQAHLDEPEPVADPKDPTRLDEVDMWGIQGLFDYRVNATAMGVQEAQRAQLNDFAQAINTVLGQNAPASLRLSIAKAMAANYNADGFQELRNEIDSLFNAAKLQEQQQQVAAQQQSAAAAQQQQGGVGAPPVAPGPPGPPPPSGLAGLAGMLAGAQGGPGGQIGAHR